MTQLWHACRHPWGPGGCHCGGSVAKRKCSHHELWRRQHAGMAALLECMHAHVLAHALRRLMGVRLPHMACLQASMQGQPC